MTQRFDLGEGLVCWVDEREITFITSATAELKFERGAPSGSVWKMSSKDSWYVVEQDIDQLILALTHMKEAIK